MKHIVAGCLIALLLLVGVGFAAPGTLDAQRLEERPVSIPAPPPPFLVEI